MSTITLPVDRWAHEQFADAELGDRRRPRRLVKVAARMAGHPAGSLPNQNEAWSDLKAAYDLLDEEDVTFDRITRPHHRRTRAQVTGSARVLVLGDTTEFDFGIHRDIDGLAPTGNGGGRGFLMHSAVAVHPEDDRVFGLLGQRVRYRGAAPRRENTTRRLGRERESEIWGQVIDAVGRPPEGTSYVHVLDRGADNFEVRCHALEQATDYVIRVAQPNRKVLDGSGAETPLKAFLEALPAAGTYAVEVPARKGHRARTATLTASFGSARVQEPKQVSPYVKRQARGPIAVWYVRVREVDPAVPPGEALEWVLETTLPVTSFEAAREVARYYAKRWLIEEWHKAIKTGCQVESKQLKTAHRLENLVAVASVVAIRLIQLRAESRTEPSRPARACVPALYVECLRRSKRLGPGEPTVRDFWRGLARLGGFLGRRRDGEPGWITIWRGWEKLVLLVRGAELFLGGADDPPNCR